MVLANKVEVNTRSSLIVAAITLIDSSIAAARLSTIRDVITAFWRPF